MARGYTDKQLGQAGEFLVAARLTLAGNPAMVMPDSWPHYDLIAQPPGQKPAARISVKTRQTGRSYSFRFELNGEWDWLAFVYLPLPPDTKAQFWLVPYKEVERAAKGKRAMPLKDVREKFDAWKNRFDLASQ